MTGKIVVIDDEPQNLSLIEAYLDGHGHDVQYFSAAGDALQYLRGGGPADVILLDRMMPATDGLSFLRDIRTLPQTGTVPVILQTAAALPAQIAEGIAAGAYYYLTKPFSREVLVAVLARALADYAGQRALQNAAAIMTTATTNIVALSVTFRSLADVRDVASFLASLYPGHDSVAFGIRELMLNAVEHGNLGITYAEKTALVRAACWEQEIERRLALPENAGKAARVHVERDGDMMILTIEDQGAGFDWTSYLEFDRARARDPHGRGIAMSRAASFDDVTFVPPGNRVVCRKRL
jgi:CheY-like chemotaxis protein/anti-sigma regulatory factor (Ser/Thr protein kinase)